MTKVKINSTMFAGKNACFSTTVTHKAGIWQREIGTRKNSSLRYRHSVGSGSRLCTITTSLACYCRR
jgi:hypothetical protein